MEVKITNDIKYTGVNDYEVDLFEGQYMLEKGMAYNSYLILDEKGNVVKVNGENTCDLEGGRRI